MVWKVNLDFDWERVGFDSSELEEISGISVSYSERLAAETALIVVATYLGKKVLDRFTDGALDKALDKLLDFAASRNRLVRLEIEKLQLDKRVDITVGIESLDRSEFRQALDALSSAKTEADRIFECVDEYIQNIYFFWDDGRWNFIYLMTEAGDVVEELSKYPYRVLSNTSSAADDEETTIVRDSTDG